MLGLVSSSLFQDCVGCALAEREFRVCGVPDLLSPYEVLQYFRDLLHRAEELLLPTWRLAGISTRVPPSLRFSLSLSPQFSLVYVNTEGEGLRACYPLAGCGMQGGPPASAVMSSRVSLLSSLGLALTLDGTVRTFIEWHSSGTPDALVCSLHEAACSGGVWRQLYWRVSGSAAALLRGVLVSVWNLI